MIQPTKRVYLKGNANHLHNYKEFLTELQLLTQKPDPVVISASLLAKQKNVHHFALRAMESLKLIKIIPGTNLEGARGRTYMYQWVKPMPVDDKLAQKVYDRTLEESRKAVQARKTKFADPNYYKEKEAKAAGKNAPALAPQVPEMTEGEERIKRAYNRKELPSLDKRIKYTGVLFAPKQLAMIGEKKLDTISTVLVDKVYSFEGVTKLFFEHSEHVLTVTFLKEYKVTTATPMGLVPEKVEERVDVIGSLVLKNKTIAMSPRFSDGKQGAFSIETIDL